MAEYPVGEAGAMEFNAVFAGVCAVLKEGRRVREEKVEKADGWTKEQEGREDVGRDEVDGAAS